MGPNFNDEDPKQEIDVKEDSGGVIQRKLSTKSTKSNKSDKSDTPAPALTAIPDLGLSSHKDVETQEKKLKYPKSVFFIISNEFCERFSYYGLRTILTIYLTQQLNYSPDSATVTYHVFTMFCYFFPVFGGIIADNWLGKYRTIFYLSIVYIVGTIVVSGGSFMGYEDGNVTAANIMTIIGLILISLGTGGIKPCVSSFGGDQFVLPQQEKQLEQFFSLFYLAINSGSLVSTFITPILREDIKCIEGKSCYPVAFGVPAILMIVSIIVFLIGKRFYRIKDPEGNVLVKVCRCVWRGIKKSWRSKEKVAHWLDRTRDKFDDKFVDEVKDTMRVLWMMLPLPIFWALFDQQGSKWTFQATRMTGKFDSFTLKPDQVQVLNPIFIVTLIPIFNYGLYPLCAKCNFLKRPLQRMVVGGLLAAGAFFMSAGVESFLEPTYAVLPKSGEAQLRIHNTLDCEVFLTIPEIELNKQSLDSLQQYDKLDIESYSETELTLSIELSSTCTITPKNFIKNQTIKAFESEATTYMIGYDQVKTELILLSSENEEIDKSGNGEPQIRLLFTDYEAPKPTTFEFHNSDGEVGLTIIMNNTAFTKFQNIIADKYEIVIKRDGATDAKITSMEFDQGGVYTVAVCNNGKKFVGSETQVTSPNTVNMLWLLPQYFVLTAGEVMYSVTGLEFAFTQAPLSMKSVLASAWLLTVAFGNLVVVIVAEANIFESKIYDFLLFAVLMVVDMIIFALMAMRYTYIDRSHDEVNLGRDKILKEEEPKSIKSDVSSVHKY